MRRRCAPSVTICAPHDALRDLRVDYRNRDALPDQRTYGFLLFSRDVIELEHNDIVVSAIDARMASEVFRDVLLVALPILSNPLNLPFDQLRRSLIVFTPVLLLAQLAFRMTTVSRDILEEELAQGFVLGARPATLHSTTVHEERANSMSL
jgi:hypothetical protein